MAAKKKTTRKSSSKAKKSMSAKQEMPISLAKANPPKLNNQILTKGLIVIAIALVVYKLGPWIFPAVVNNAPVSRFELIKRLEQSYGAQTLDDLVNEKILDAAIKDSGVKVAQEKIDEQVSALEEQFASLGGIEEALKQRGLTRKDLVKQITTQLAVEEILAGKIAVTDEEVAEEYETNADTLYADQELSVVSAQIITQLRDAKLRDAFLEWFAEVKETAKVKNYGL